MKRALLFKEVYLGFVSLDLIGQLNFNPIINIDLNQIILYNPIEEPEVVVVVESSEDEDKAEEESNEGSWELEWRR